MSTRVIVVTMDVPESVSDQELANRVQRILCQAAHPDDNDPRQIGLTWPDYASIDTTVYRPGEGG